MKPPGCTEPPMGCAERGRAHRAQGFLSSAPPAVQNGVTRAERRGASTQNTPIALQSTVTWAKRKGVPANTPNAMCSAVTRAEQGDEAVQNGLTSDLTFSPSKTFEANRARALDAFCPATSNRT